MSRGLYTLGFNEGFGRVAIVDVFNVGEEWWMARGTCEKRQIW